ncbi:MAG: hypothetical protein GX854_09055 [Clostridiales bacterium]|nr:hypothetical protein [Clostridiales bacterium]
MIEAFRSERQLDDRGIQGIHPLRHSRNLLSGIQRLLNTYGPLIETFRGDE